MNFKIYELMDVVPFGESSNKTIAVFIHASNQVVCHTDVNCPARAPCEDINVELSHGLAFLIEMAGTSPAMTSREVLAKMTGNGFSGPCFEVRVRGAAMYHKLRKRGTRTKIEAIPKYMHQFF
jgi:hypothetical protein